MTDAASKIDGLHLPEKPLVVAAQTPRAIESAKIIAHLLKSAEPNEYPDLYAAEEDGNLPKLEHAKALLDHLGASANVIVAVVSREYIQALPNYLIGTSQDTLLDRGECLVVDTTTKTMSFIRH